MSIYFGVIVNSDYFFLLNADFIKNIDNIQYVNINVDWAINLGSMENIIL